MQLMSLQSRICYKMVSIEKKSIYKAINPIDSHFSSRSRDDTKKMLAT